MGRHISDLTGKKFHRLTVSEFSHVNKNQRASYWKCVCDCGNVIVTRHSSLKCGNTKSCGCLQKEIAAVTGLAEVRRRTLPFGLAAKRQLFRSYKKGALEKNRKFDISFETFLEMTKSNCHYCGRKPAQKYWNNRWNGNYIYNGIDRVNPKKGYTSDNCVPCCKYCNVAKMGLSKTKFLNLIKKIYRCRIGVQK